MPKKYHGRNLPDLLKGPKTRTIPNPDKEEKVSIEKPWINWWKKEIKGVNCIDTIGEMLIHLEQLWHKAKRNEDKPDEVEEVLWTGSIQTEFKKCGKPNCQCKSGKKVHGPYYIHYF